MDAGLFVKADLDNLVALAGKAPRRRTIDVPAAFQAVRRTAPSSDGAGAGAEEAGDDVGGGGHTRAKRMLAEGSAVAAAAALAAAGAAALEGRRPRVAGIPLPLPRRSLAKRAIEGLSLPSLPLPHQQSGAKRAVGRVTDLLPSR